ncbi:DUF1348 family protein [Ruegeria profundi]|nr:DUF1348 family protein [Ruegeria profundi]
MTRPPLPPSTWDGAMQRVRMAATAWNGRDADVVTPDVTDDSELGNRTEFLSVHKAAQALLPRVWNTEQDDRLIKELWDNSGNRIAARILYELPGKNEQRLRHCGSEECELAAKGRPHHWTQNPRPEDRPSFHALGH